MWKLPVEIWQKIMRLLSAEDMENCSKVCKFWESVLDADILWKPICLKKGWTKIHQTTNENELGEGEDSSSRCQWRAIYRSNRKLETRWMSKIWTRHVLGSRGHQGEVFSMYSDPEYLVVGYQNGTVLVWCISTKPQIKSTIKCILPNYPVLEVKISKGMVAAVQDRLVQVFDVTTAQPTINRVICMDLGPTCSDLTSSWTSLPYFHSWYRECLRVNDIKTSKRLLTTLAGSHLIVCTGEEGSLYTWSLKSKSQSKNFIIEGKVKELITWEKAIYIVGWERRSSKIYEYSGNEGCLDELIDSPDICKTCLSENFIVTFPAESGFSLQKIRVWSRKDGRFINYYSICCATTYVCVTETNVVIFSQENTVFMWDPVTNYILHRISFLTPSCGVLPVNFIDACFSDFLVILLGNALCVYNWSKGEKLYSINTELEWSEDYVNLVWTCPTAMVIGGIYNKPELLSFV